MQALTHTRLMSISRDEFLRVLPVMLDPGDEFRITENGVRIIFGESVVDVQLQLQPDIAIASLRLPSLQVNIIIAPAVSDAFMSRFERAFQRGGG
jgi:hypothetical protein